MTARLVVLIPHFDNLEGLRRSIQSIDETHSIDVLIVDDGSAQPPELGQVKRWFTGAGQVDIYQRESNAGIEAALNDGLAIARERGYEFVGRLDCGDRNVKQRFVRQIEYLDGHPEVVLLGGAAAFVDQSGHTLFVRSMPTEHGDIAKFMRFNNAFMHPTVVLRTRVIDDVGDYPLGYPAAEDYAFFWTIMEVGRVANLPDVLIDYEVDPDGISRSRRERQLRSRLQVQSDHSDGSVRARAGILRTLILLKAPVGAVDAMKARLYGKG
jgi:glycosyltransferase involved in cell wall biosynthesis